MNQQRKHAVIIGAGPAGLTAAYELLTRTDIIPVIIEQSHDIGGISKTVVYKGNRIDIGGHRFFSKSQRVMDFWLNIMPLENDALEQFEIRYHNRNATVTPKEHDETTSKRKAMLVRRRLSRIYFLNRFFSYPLAMDLQTIKNLGLWRTFRVGVSYLYSSIFPIRQERSLEDFFINRFGRYLYKLFFRSYTEKVWGKSCREISAEWGAQRIKGLDVAKALKHALNAAFGNSEKSIRQKNIETSLIEQFLYPRLGPGQLWEEVARSVLEMGGEIHFGHKVTSIMQKEGSIVQVESALNDGKKVSLSGDYFFSTMPVKELVQGLSGGVPEQVRIVAQGLEYRDFITVGVLLNRLSTAIDGIGRKTINLADNWIYIQDASVQVGRLQLFNNWSPDMVADPDTVWLGMEFFCQSGDAFWSLSNHQIAALAVTELTKINLAAREDVLDTCVIRMEKAYPAYFGSYGEFDQVRTYLDSFENLFLIGRNGMHKYNNSDHSMLTAMTAVDNIISGEKAKDNIWKINTEKEYHERVIDASKNNGVEKPVDALPALGNQEKEKEREPESFRAFVLRKENRNLCLVVLGFCAAMWGVFKWYYPIPAFINGDSYEYITSAANNFSIHTYPIGYPRFLRLVSVFTSSDLYLVSLQFMMLQLSILYFLMRMFFITSASGILKITVTLLTCCNPVFYYVANYVSSDSLFLTLSLIWVTTLLGIIYRPSRSLILTHSLIIFLAFTVRYNALWYPCISFIGIMLGGRKMMVWKLSGFIAGCLLIMLFVQTTQKGYQRISGIYQFSPFSGWQIANNAINAYRFVESEDRIHLPGKYTGIDNDVRNYIDSTRNVGRFPQERLLASTFYMWDSTSPLRVYMKKTFGRNNMNASEAIMWSKAGNLYGDYGNELIKRYPREFLLYYLYPNFLKFYSPPTEFLSMYNTRQDSIMPIAKSWFRYDSVKFPERGRHQVTILEWMPLVVGMLNAVYLMVGFSLFLIMRKNIPSKIAKAWGLLTLIWLANMFFSIYAAPVSLRMQLFGFICCSVSIFIWLDAILRYDTSGKLKEQRQKLDTSPVDGHVLNLQQ
ncbi:NAD(P)/FAD-dependent oxidoreductase [Pedobacter paludis]|uniref:Amine oxidase domain-containing protein n=1 Tax=Pedobacter paludis TaxID=2203212 RepID=A0A317F0E6_9SPHI|nr:NAD(P)/FAD-dependent oxidoreductase [Pedobacter paludis]PWS32235.1 hypothetical protein DF947_10730 [Pedobacter paludis]